MEEDLHGKNYGAASMHAAPGPPAPPKGIYRVLGALLGGQGVRESVTTSLYLDEPPHSAWQFVVFYEDIPGSPPLLLRALIPRPVRTEGNKAVPGSLIRCTYAGGSLIKRILKVDQPQRVEFEVIDQHLGIESCVLALTGSYSLQPRGSGVNVELTTNYLAFLRPRWLWRPLERIALHQLHRHILKGMRCALARTPSPSPGRTTGLELNTRSPGEEACTSQSRPLR
ncbi:MAG TPA: hypothetical protein VG714_02705 [Acidobacteriaceae bacterium]|nr:hypothetical protein [Acidobacteriaceae bacterium]